jgi:hypothetical protein
VWTEVIYPEGFLVPVNGSCNLRKNGRPKGAKGKYTRVLRQAIVLAAEKSKNSKSSNLEGYCLFLADDRPELFVSLLARLLPIQARIETENHGVGDVTNIINFNMPLSEMVNVFESRIKSAYMPTASLSGPDDDDENYIEHSDVGEFDA